ncbi:MAG: carotenoid biosynthesis protein [Chitinophagales bacterium]
MLPPKTFLPFYFFTAILLLLHGVGLVSFTQQIYYDFCLRTTPLVLLISAAMVLYAAADKNACWYRFVVYCILVAWFVEVAGVHTKAIFGAYTYGSTLGIKVLGVPPLIGVNWLLCIMGAASLSLYLGKHWKIGQNAFLAALITVLYDFLLEPVAIKLQYWSWENGLPTFQNYLGWWVVSFFFTFVYYRWVLRLLTN